ncbi:hypothetical protein [Kribbella sp. CA-294648]
MPTGLLLWIVAVAATIAGLISVLRFRIVLGALLIATGMALGLVSARYLN